MLHSKNGLLHINTQRSPAVSPVASPAERTQTPRRTACQGHRRGPGHQVGHQHDRRARGHQGRPWRHQTSALVIRLVTSTIDVHVVIRDGRGAVDVGLVIRLVTSTIDVHVVIRDGRGTATSTCRGPSAE